ncbi:(2Fe-2S) ferredoxin domain-containing protein [Methylotuvimicrobium buryatense]|uniref:(2Fe-2S) ferredoxin domain-containing protein n=1 Tax=Methylotuvimicrobium buryatense TaxID=95641 RepID=A0A4P9URB9_METBY|nr:ferredoxin [Methylotuvimicrobium buryatense]QCW83093.1 (2Fe-2S) ferredoxin domain-containing protein [Methylotuvimicrobium buryatense]
MNYYKHHVFFCTNQRENGAACCQDHDAQFFRDYAKTQLKKLKMSGSGKCRINNAGCLDRCKEGPVMVVYPDAIWYRYENQADIDEIIEEHLQNGRVVERLKV